MMSRLGKSALPSRYRFLLLRACALLSPSLYDIYSLSLQTEVTSTAPRNTKTYSFFLQVFSVPLAGRYPKETRYTLLQAALFARVEKLRRASNSISRNHLQKFMTDHQHTMGSRLKHMIEM